jgi:hypothetical protein
MMKNKKTLPTVAMVTVAMAALLASATIASYNTHDVFAKKKYGDSNAQSSAAINDCPSELLSLIIGIQIQTSANCLNDLNSVQDSDGAAISSAPFNAAPNQAIDLDLDLAPSPPPTCAECLAPLLEQEGLAISVAISFGLGVFDTDEEAIEAICENLSIPPSQGQTIGELDAAMEAEFVPPDVRA